ncbi:putative bifunctional diguanylate cyclase/phosphodiesterase [Martelella limonii]|uniref:putative bifunctional diguanylate cyclase/phosphodiesterase n=1 Tax=Martelella limonii TaxID=1647649 RepID=UPI0015812BCB|nr:EAL domain-containing protein [Martelella limonii]
MLFAGGILCVIGLAWGAIYVFYGKWLMVDLMALAIVLGVCLLVLTRRGLSYLAAIVGVHTLIPLIILMCLFDSPGLGVARSWHMYFIPVAAGAILVFRKSGCYLRFFLPGIALIACAFFAAGTFSFPMGDAASPAEIRSAAVWVNAFTALGALAVVLFLMQLDLSERRAWETDLRAALAKGRFYLAYQPQVGRDGKVYGAEALLRWRDPRRGQVPPGEFIPFAEETGLIGPIGEWVLREATGQIARWAENPATERLTLSVNVSTSQFHQPSFVTDVIEILKRSNAPASRLKLELTESVFNVDLDGTVRKMEELRDLGIRLSLDDFGTGYSSLSVVRKLPLDELKIDQSFVREVAENASDKAIVQTLVSLGRSLNLFLIAEGISEEEQFKILRQAGCNAFQGYFFGLPVRIEEFEALYIRGANS